jgi:hypothetical protein
MPAADLDQAITKPATPTGDMGHQQTRRPSAWKIRLGRGFGDEPALELAL